MDDTTLLAAWGRGWALSRGTAQPQALEDGAWRIAVGQPGHIERHLLPAWLLPRLRAWAEREARPGLWLKVLADPVALALPAPWTVHATEYLMSAPLDAKPQPTLAPGYRLDWVTDGPNAECHALAADGEVAARARVAWSGTHAVFDQVVTAAAHQRRGLARQLLARLYDLARGQGAGTGVLVATEEGRALYTALGWRVNALVTAASVDAL